MKKTFFEFLYNFIFISFLQSVISIQLFQKRNNNFIIKPKIYSHFTIYILPESLFLSKQKIKSFLINYHYQITASTSFSIHRKPWRGPLWCRLPHRLAHARGPLLLSNRSVSAPESRPLCTFHRVFWKNLKLGITEEFKNWEYRKFEEKLKNQKNSKKSFFGIFLNFNSWKFFKNNIKF